MTGYRPHRRPVSSVIQGPFCPIPRPELLALRLRKGKYKFTVAGLEKFCARCQSYWPADTEFFFPCRTNRDGLHEWCRACYMEWRWPERYDASAIAHGRAA